MDFTVLQFRLVTRLRALVRSGELTERSLARRTGISQPHMHHVLKGTRALSPEMSDQVLRALGLNLIELMEADDSSSEVPPGS